MFEVGLIAPRITRRNQMKALTYLIYILAWESMVLGEAYYAVFVLNRSGWWFLLAVLLSGAAYKPSDWL